MGELIWRFIESKWFGIADGEEAQRPCRWWNRWLCINHLFGVPIYHSWRCKVCSRIVRG